MARCKLLRLGPSLSRALSPPRPSSHAPVPLAQQPQGYGRPPFPCPPCPSHAHVFRAQVSFGFFEAFKRAAANSVLLNLVREHIKGTNRKASLSGSGNRCSIQADRVTREGRSGKQRALGTGMHAAA